MLTKQQYELMLPYKPIIDLFMKCKEYVGGGDGLLAIYEEQFATKVSARCPGCFGAMLIDCHNRMKQYESNM